MTVCVNLPVLLTSALLVFVFKKALHPGIFDQAANDIEYFYCPFRILWRRNTLVPFDYQIHFFFLK
jgi:hypothetical protein